MAGYFHISHPSSHGISPSLGGAQQEGLPQAKAAAPIFTPALPAVVLIVLPALTSPHGSFGGAPAENPSAVHLFQIGESVRVLARKTPGVDSTLATGILPATIVGVEGPNENLVRAGGADLAS